LITLFYNLLMAVVVLGTWVVLRDRPTVGKLLLAVPLNLLASFCLAILVAAHAFAAMGLFAYGVFLHLPIVLLCGAYYLRGHSRKWAAVCLAGVVSVCAVAVDAFLIEPHWLEVTHYQWQSSKLDKPLRIVVIADLQAEEFGRFERRALQQALDEKPDVILLAGDYIQCDRAEQRAGLRSDLRALLQELDLRAPHGVFAVRGDWDRRKWTESFEGLDVHAFERTGHLLLPGRKDVRLTGLEPGLSARTDAAVEGSYQFNICLGHYPNFALGSVEADLLIAGHTHGGQVRLPGFGPLLTLSEVPRSWAAGKTELPGGRTLLVSRGIGMERGSAPRLRFFCRPELMVIDVLPEKS